MDLLMPSMPFRAFINILSFGTGKIGFFAKFFLLEERAFLIEASIFLRLEEDLEDWEESLFPFKSSGEQSSTKIPRPKDI